MPLDPFFQERLRVHRRYLLGQAWDGVRGRISDIRTRITGSGRVVAPVPAAPAPVPGAESNVAPSASATPTTPLTASASGAHAVKRAKHRAAALRWDRTEQRTVGSTPPKVDTEEHVVAVLGQPDVRVRVYRPRDQGERILPVVVSFFGGAFRIGGIDYPTTDAAYRRRTVDADVVTVAVDYALAPEHRYPCAVEQSYAALVWVAENAGSLRVDPERLAVQGTSAGGDLAAVMTLMARDRRGPAIALQVLEVPVVDLTGGNIDFRATWALGIPMFIAVRELVSVARTYLGDRTRAREPYASPIRASSHRHLPPAVILTAEYDPLRKMGDAYGAALRRAGGDASVVRYLGVNHDVSIFTGALPAARRWHADVVSAYRRLHGSAVVMSGHSASE